MTLVAVVEVVVVAVVVAVVAAVVALTHFEDSLHLQSPFLGQIQENSKTAN